MERLLQDLRYTSRGLRRQPGFFLATVLSLALGMGVNTAIFSATDSLLWKALPVRNPDRTIYVFHSSPANADQGTSFRAFDTYRGRSDLFFSVMAFSGARPMLLDEAGRSETVYVQPVTAGFFSIADVALEAGRPLDAGADVVGDASLAVILSHRSWMRRFGADPAIVGRAIQLNGRLFIVAGITRAGFTGFDPEVSVDLWIPVTAWAHVVGEPERLTSDEHWLTTIATLRDGVSREQAQSALATMSSVRTSAEQQVRVRPISERLSGTDTDVIIISAAALLAGTLVLVLAWTNAASLVIARAAARQREMSVRAALGGSRVQLVRLWLVETALISAVACVGAIVLAWWIVGAAVAFELPVGIGHSGSATLAIDFHLNARVVTFVLGLSTLSAVVVSLLSGVRLTTARAMRLTDGWTERRFLPGLNLRSAVLGLQLVLSLVLLIPAGLLVRSWINGATTDPGFSADNVLLVPISSHQSGTRVAKPADFEMQLIARVRSLPGVQSVTALDPVPLWFAGNSAFYAADDGSSARPLAFARVAPEYFRTLRLPLVQGRDFTTADDASAPPVAIVNETLARQFFPGANALGRTIRHGTLTIAIVGISADAKYRSLAEPPQPMLYHPLAQEPTDNPSLSLAVRIARDSTELRQRIEREVRALAPGWPAVGFRRLDEGVAFQRLIPRTGATVLGVLGIFALALAAVGIYGVTAYVVTARTREMGIRLALGSPPGRVSTLIVMQVMRVCVPGAVVGTALALAASRILAAVLIATSPADAMTLVAIPLGLLGVATLAAYLPARRAARTNPLSALRAE